MEPPLAEVVRRARRRVRPGHAPRARLDPALAHLRARHEESLAAALKEAAR
ncbi:hypothetical protein [Nonomuraea sp. 10N515B]|uniref:hypothetical protein n=1 Tax=Nonomuraea sp. 10N515B TaxID=3457422 RepID=UPI003FCC5634